ncbi:hypothetical protein GGQ61_001824 [Phenylobacterium haematophilum]|jgi:hypothetical protein|uniref:Uncharacterized protein n=1 Tax=Phenylobacterium haematophilum TaxID=98513 RepID=A0A840A188_9CAUL|nr:hypothetical protein [Phenylobacterium haematophilum]
MSRILIQTTIPTTPDDWHRPLRPDDLAAAAEQMEPQP